MAEKRRFKQNREFKKRLDEQEENAEADIRSFRFRSLERKETREFRKPEKAGDGRKPRRFGDSKDAKDFKNRGGHERFDRSRGKKPYKNNRDFGKKNRRVHDDEKD